ncbi:MAG: hypothetical protein H5T78_04525 [Nocardia sp.]|nr:hypothetical protein [Nocardia sp.]
MTPRPTTPLSFVGLAQALQSAENAQGRAATADGKLQGAGQGTDPDYVTTDDRFQGMTYDELYQAVHGEGGLDPAGLQGQSGVWRQGSSDVLNLSTFNLLGMTRLFNEGQWQGATADAGQAATEAFARALNEVGQVLGSVGARVEAVGFAAEAVKVAVQPRQISSGILDPDDPVQSILPGLSNPATDEQTRAADAAAREAIIQALDTTYTPVFPPSGAGVPAYVDMPVISGDPGAADPGAGGSNGQNTGLGAEQGSPETGDPAATTPAPTDTEGSSQSSEQSSGDDASRGQDSGDAATDPSSTAPAGTAAAAAQAGSPSTGGPSSGGPGSGSAGSGSPGSGSPGAGGPGGSVGGGAGAVLGRAVPGVGTPSTGPGIAAASGTGAGSGTRNGMMPGMGGAGRGGNREEPNEHYAPDYLRGIHPDWTEGILTYDGVVGSEVELMPGAQSSAPTSPNQGFSTTAASTAPAAEIQRQQPVSPPFPVSAPHDFTRESGVAATAPPVSSPQQGRPERSEPATPVGSTTTPAAVPDEPRTNQQAAEQFFEHSGAGPVMDDEPVPAGQNAEGASESPSADQFFEHSGTGPMMDDEPAPAPRQ